MSEENTYKRSPAGTSHAGKTLGTPDAQAINRKSEREALYADRVKVYPRRVYGKFRMVKWVVMSVTLAIYYLLPFLRWDRGEGFPSQALLIDLPARKAWFFGIEIWAQEVYYVTGLLILAAFVLFLVTSLAGRVWCGYACPQTVWTDLFVHIERWIEGDRNQRMRLDKAPWSVSKALKKVIKHILWLLVALATGGAFVFYFADAPTLAVDLVTLDAPMTSYVFVGMLTAFTYVFGGWGREQVCIYMCPWPRIQGALVDKHSLLITYDENRGEERGPHKKGTTWDGRGDCIDCKQCVAVCPMGIDIRDGFQMECIQCALCIDACNGIMGKVERPKGLIRYAPGHVQDAGGLNLEKTKAIRPRTIIYTVIIALVSLIMLATLVTRSDLEASASRDRNPVFVTLSSGDIRNGYSLHLLNKQLVARPMTIEVRGLDGLQLRTPLGEWSDSIDVSVGADQGLEVRVFVAVPRGQANGRQEIEFVVTSLNDQIVRTVDNSFIGPDR